MIVDTRMLRRQRKHRMRKSSALGAFEWRTSSTIGVGATAGISRVAGKGELVNLSRAAHVYWNSGLTGLLPNVRLFAPGGTKCDPAILGATGVAANNGSCSIEPDVMSPFGAPIRLRPSDTIARRAAEQGQPFQLTEPATVYYGTGINPGPANMGGGTQNADSPLGAWMVHDMLPGTYPCDNDPFGPDPVSRYKKRCYVVPHQKPDVAAPISTQQRLAAEQAAEERAAVAVQAQQNVYAAQLAIQQQQADAQAQLAQLARDAATQQAAAQRAAETYRAIQEEAAKQATAMAVELAKLAYANEHDADLARAAAETAAQAESIRQATEAARKSEEERARATLAAQAAALEMVRAQEQYEAKLEVTERAAQTQADLTAAGAAGGGVAGLDMKKILIFGGLGLAAVFVLMSD